MSALIRTFAFCGVLLLLGSFSASAYTIVFKDGSTIVTREKYRVEDGQAYVTLLSGTDTYYRLEDIDVQKTEETNLIEIGAAIVLEGGDSRPFEALQSSTATLRDLLIERAKNGAPKRQPKTTKTDASLRFSPAGNLDLSSLPRLPFEPEADARAIVSLLRQQGLATSRVLQGSQSDRILVEFSVQNRGEVFETLRMCAGAFVEAVESFPELEAMELVLHSAQRSRAGQFVVSPQDAIGLAEGSIEAPAYFFSNVLF